MNAWLRYAGSTVLAATSASAVGAPIENHDISAAVGVTSQIATIVQQAIKAPTPGNLDSYFNGASTSGSPQFGLSQAGYYTSDTTNGNLLICCVTIATDAHDPDPTKGNQIFSCSDPVNGAWTLAGTLDNITSCNNQTKVFYKFNAQPLQTTAWTGLTSCAGGVLTLISGSGNFRIGQRINNANVTPPTNTGGECVVASLASGTLGAPGSTYNLGINPGNYSSSTTTTTDFVQVVRSQIFSFTDYPAQWLLEISGTDGSSFYFSGHNDAPTGSGTDTVTSGLLSVPSSPGLLFGFVFNGGLNSFSNTGAAGPYVAAAGSTFTNSSAVMPFDQTGALCRIEWQHYASIGSRAATGSPPALSNYATVGFAVLDHP